MDNSNSWTCKKDIYDDFDMLSEFYDPKVAEKNKRLSLPRGRRNRGTKVVSSDSDSADENQVLPDVGPYIPKDDLQELDPDQQIEVQAQLRRALGVGYSNQVIESHWRNNYVKSETESSHSSTKNDDIDVPDSSSSSATSTVDNSDDSSDELSENVSRTSNTTEALAELNISKEISLNISSSPQYMESPNQSIEHYNNIVARNGYSTVDVEYFSDDDNIIVGVEDTDRNSSTRTDSSNAEISYDISTLCDGLPIKKEGRRKKAKSKFIPIPAESVVNVTAVKLNPNAPVFRSQKYFFNDHDYKLQSTNDFPPL